MVSHGLESLIYFINKTATKYHLSILFKSYYYKHAIFIELVLSENQTYYSIDALRNITHTFLSIPTIPSEIYHSNPTIYATLATNR